jgi:hypothetical protein
MSIVDCILIVIYDEFLPYLRDHIGMQELYIPWSRRLVDVNGSAIYFINPVIWDLV